MTYTYERERIVCNLSYKLIFMAFLQYMYGSPKFKNKIELKCVNNTFMCHVHMLQMAQLMVVKIQVKIFFSLLFLQSERQKCTENLKISNVSQSITIIYQLVNRSWFKTMPVFDLKNTLQ